MEDFSSLGSDISIDISKASLAQKVEKLQPMLGAPKSNRSYVFCYRFPSLVG
jgi:hypothetical protein